MSFVEELAIDRVVEPIRQHIVPVLRQALDVCVERHKLGEGEGADGFSFGTDAWSFPARRFRELSDEEEFPFKSGGGSGCKLMWDGIQLRHHRVGHTESESIAESFPSGAKALASEAGPQLELFDEAARWNPGEHRGVLAIAYMANPTDGLCAVYVASVAETDSQTGCIIKWGDTRLIWRLDRIESGIDATSQLAPPEQHRKPVVTRRKVGKKKPSNANDEQ